MQLGFPNVLGLMSTYQLFIFFPDVRGLCLISHDMMNLKYRLLLSVLSLAATGTMEWPDRTNNYKQDRRPAERIRFGRHQPEGGWLGEGEPSDLCLYGGHRPPCCCLSVCLF